MQVFSMCFSFSLKREWTYIKKSRMKRLIEEIGNDGKSLDCLSRYLNRYSFHFSFVFLFVQPILLFLVFKLVYKYVFVLKLRGESV